jgi:DNA-directed RNA polymerase subunit L
MGGGFRGIRESYAKRRYEPNPIEQHGPQKSLEDYPESSKPRVFISFHVDDENQVNLLRHQAKNSDQMEFIDYSVKEPFDEKWKTQCTERIRQSSVIVVAIGERTHEREAVDWEIRKAHELGKPVIGMRIYSDKNDKVPRAMVEHGDRVVQWNLETIQSEIDTVREAD